MGTATNQMITRSDVNDLIRKGLFFSNLNKCVTKNECASYDLIVASGSRDNNQCIPKSDISRGTGPITIYYGIYNNKDSAVTLDYLKVQISPHPNTTWTQIGSTNPGTISKYGTKTGSISCTIPTSLDLKSDTYELRLFCGNTLIDQQWYFCWGNSANITTLADYYWGTVRTDSDQAITNTDRAYSWRIAFMAPNESYTTAVLDSSANTSGGRGRSTTRAALFMIK